MAAMFICGVAALVAGLAADGSPGGYIAGVGLAVVLGIVTDLRSRRAA